MPGFSKDSIDVDFYNNQIKITGYKPSPVLLDDEKVKKSNVKCGQFQESITLPVSVTSRENVSVKYEDGILRIIIDLVREEKNRFKINLGSTNASDDDEPPPLMD
jgi:HSP20 family molecular chaperone IbpA